MPALSVIARDLRIPQRRGACRLPDLDLTLKGGVCCREILGTVIAGPGFEASGTHAAAHATTFFKKLDEVSLRGQRLGATQTCETCSNNCDVAWLSHGERNFR